MPNKTGLQMMKPVMALAGERETGSGNNTTVNKYWGMSGQPYCVYTILYADKVSGDPKILSGYGGSGNCRPLGEWLTAKGWRLSDNSKAQAGDIAFYCQYNEKEKRWMYQHVFFIYEKVAGTQYITLEGNTKCYATLAKAKASAADTGEYEGIGFKKRNMPTSGTWAIFHPPYSGCGVAEPVKKFSISLGILKKGMQGGQVKALQQLLIANGFSCGSSGADGDFGQKTKDAVVAFQKKKFPSSPSEWDGEAGQKTFEKLMGL